MPTFDFTSPDGKSYSVDGPEGATSAQAFQILQQHLGGDQAPPNEGGSISGIGKSLASGLGQGLLGIAGLPADIAHLYATNPNDPNPLGAEGLQKQVEKYTGEFHKPQGRLEDAANLAGQFAPAMVGGPESLLVKGATRVAAPAIAAETAAAATNDNPLAKAGWALVGAMTGPAAFNRAIKAFKSGNVEPELQDIKAASQAGYRSQDVKDVKFAAAPTNDLADKITLSLRDQGFRPNIETSGKPVFQLVDELRGASNVGDLESVRRALGNIAKEKSPVGMPTPNAAAASATMGHINNFLPNLTQPDLIAGNAQKASDILKTAGQDWGAYQRAKTAQNILENGLTNASAAHSGGNVSNSVRQAFKPFVKNDFAKAAGYTDEEKAALKRIVSGTLLGNIARTGSKMLGAGGGLGAVIGGEVGYHEGGLPGLVGGALAGKTLRKISDKSTMNAVGKLDRMLRSRSPEAIKMAAQLPPQVAAALPPATIQRLQALIALDPVLREQVAQPVPAESYQQSQ